MLFHKEELLKELELETQIQSVVQQLQLVLVTLYHKEVDPLSELALLMLSHLEAQLLLQELEVLHQEVVLVMLTLYWLKAT
jgi:hypothetical protein